MKTLLLTLLLTLGAFITQAREQTLTFTIPIASISGADTTINISLTENIVWGLQVNSVGLTGTLNGTLDLTQTNDGTNFNTLVGFTTLALSSANATKSFESSFFSHKTMNIKITKVGLTGGNIELIMSYKTMQ